MRSTSCNTLISQAPFSRLTVKADLAIMDGITMSYIGSPSEPTSQLGFVYLLTSPSMPGLVKVGATRKHPLQRARELSAGTGVPTDFKVAYFRDFDDCFLAEALTHEAFAEYRVNEGREFFEVSLGELVAFVDRLASSRGYQDGLGSAGVTGGTWDKGQQFRATQSVSTPFADLFATFPDRGDGVLNAEERAACRALEQRR